MISVDVMLSKPGVWVVVAMGHDGRTTAALVEVDAAGRAFQLELSSGRFERDGELSGGQWNLSRLVDLRGPFRRDQLAWRRVP